MANLKIIRPNGEGEIAELTTNKSDVGNNYVTLTIDGTLYYARLGDVVDTHMYVFNGLDGRKYYIQKEIQDIPVMDIKGTLIITANLWGMQIKDKDITNTGTHGQLKRITMNPTGGVWYVNIGVDGISDVYNAYQNKYHETMNCMVNIGPVTFTAFASGEDVMVGKILQHHVNQLRQVAGRPVDFSITRL